ncbi:hypothetical protein [Streptomyces sp. NPDC015130]|uniref:hypothetical protein n=1 Tax=Streptomyces sp. NPDC015130 TaxID=3364940 RepID=UPI0036F68848
MRPALHTARAWIGVHSVKPALVLLAVSAALSLMGAKAMLDSLGFMVFETPVSLLLLVPTIAGVAVAVGTDNTARIPLPEPLRLIGTRLGWMTVLTMAAAAAANLGQLIGPAVPWQAGLRNTLVHASLAVATSALGYISVAWLPPVGLTLASMLFGYPPSEPRYYWWAVIMEKEVTSGQWASVIGAFTAAACIYALAPARRLHLGKHPFTAAPERQADLLVRSKP